MCFKYLLNRKYTAFEYMKTNKFLNNSLLQFKMQPSTDLQNVAIIQNNIYKINFKFSEQMCRATSYTFFYNISNE